MTSDYHQDHWLLHKYFCIILYNIFTVFLSGIELLRQSEHPSDLNKSIKRLQKGRSTRLFARQVGKIIIDERTSMTRTSYPPTWWPFLIHLSGCEAFRLRFTHANALLTGLAGDTRGLRFVWNPVTAQRPEERGVWLKWRDFWNVTTWDVLFILFK